MSHKMSILLVLMILHVSFALSEYFQFINSRYNWIWTMPIILLFLTLIKYSQKMQKFLDFHRYPFWQINVLCILHTPILFILWGDLPCLECQIQNNLPFFKILNMCTLASWNGVFDWTDADVLTVNTYNSLIVVPRLPVLFNDDEPVQIHWYFQSKNFWKPKHFVIHVWY